MHHVAIITLVIIVTAACSMADPVSQPVLSRTLPASWDENWFGSPAVYDLDGDGSREIIAGRHSVLYAWNAQGLKLWRAPVGENASSPNDHGSGRQYAAPVVGDLDNDGNGEIAIAYDNKVAVYDHQGALLPGWPQAFPNVSHEIRSIAAADLDKDGKCEIMVVKTMDTPVTMVWRINGAAFPGWPQMQGCRNCNDYGGFDQNVGAADLDGNGTPEVVGTYDICHIGIMYADGKQFPAAPSFSAAGPWASSVPMFHSIALAQQGWGADGNDRDEFTDSPPCFGDLDNDGKPEIVLYSNHEKAGGPFMLGNCLWALNPDMTRVQGFETPLCSGAYPASDLPLDPGYVNNIVLTQPVPALGNLLDDSRPEIVVPSYDGVVRCYRPDGRLAWQYRFDADDGIFNGASGAVIADLNRDNVCEVIFTTYAVQQDRSHLIVLDATGNMLHKVPLAKRGCMAPPAAADVDGDGGVEIVLSLKDVLGGTSGGVQVWDVPSAGVNLAPWPTGRGNNLRTGEPAAAESAVRTPAVKGSLTHYHASRQAYTVRGERLRVRIGEHKSRWRGAFFPLFYH